MADRGGMLQVHCEDPVLLDAAVASALQRGDVSPRYHATTRPSYVEAVATARAMAFARMADAPVHVVHLSSAAALDEVRRAKAAGRERLGRDVPALPRPDRRALRRSGSRVVRPLRHLAAAPLPRRPRRAVGRVSPTARSTSSRPTMSRTAVGTEKAEAASGVAVQRDQQRRARHRDAPDDPLQRGRRQGPDHARADGRPPGDDARRAASGFERKGAIEVGRDADIVLFDPAAHRTIRAADLHHTSDYTPYEGLEVTGAVRDVFVRGRPVIRDGAFVGRRGAGPFVERGRPSRLTVGDRPNAPERASSRAGTCRHA